MRDGAVVKQGCVHLSFLFFFFNEMMNSFILCREPESFTCMISSISDFFICEAVILSGLYGYDSFYMRMGIVVDQFKIIKTKIKNIFDGGVQLHGWQGSRFSGKLQINLLKMVIVNMGITKGMNKFAIL